MMEIGISTGQLIDISLNAAGFLAAGSLMLVIRSIFRRPVRVNCPTVIEKSGYIKNQTIEDSRPAERPAVPDFEFVNLREAAARPRMSGGNLPSGNRPGGRDRQEIIRMAQDILAGKERHQAGSPPAADGGFSMIKQNLNFQGAGRSR
nr:hypothetical protein [candidate division Zixibacteria bacterium]